MKIATSEQSVLKADYKALVQGVDFSDSYVIPAVNNWAAGHTNGLIPEPLRSVEEDVAAVLVNALYFSGSWQTAFDPSGTAKQWFVTAAGEKIDKEFMTAEQHFEYAENGQFQFVKLPYGNGRFAMTVALPKNNAASLSNAADLRAISFEEEKVLLSIPKFEIETEANLKELLCSAGVSRIDGMFLRLGDSAVPLSKMYQTSAIRIDEQGTRAASVSSAQGAGAPIGPDDLFDPIVFNANHPFYIFISNADLKVILFAAHYSGRE